MGSNLPSELSFGEKAITTCVACLYEARDGINHETLVAHNLLELGFRSGVGELLATSEMEGLRGGYAQVTSHTGSLVETGPYVGQNKRYLDAELMSLVGMEMEVRALATELVDSTDPNFYDKGKKREDPQEERLCRIENAIHALNADGAGFILYCHRMLELAGQGDRLEQMDVLTRYFLISLLIKSYKFDARADLYMHGETIQATVMPKIDLTGWAVPFEYSSKVMSKVVEVAQLQKNAE